MTRTAWATVAKLPGEQGYQLFFQGLGRRQIKIFPTVDEAEEYGVALGREWSCTTHIKLPEGTKYSVLPDVPIVAYNGTQEPTEEAVDEEDLGESSVSVEHDHIESAGHEEHADEPTDEPTDNPEGPNYTLIYNADIRGEGPSLFDKDGRMVLWGEDIIIEFKSYRPSDKTVKVIITNNTEELLVLWRKTLAYSGGSDTIVSANQTRETRFSLHTEEPNRWPLVLRHKGQDGPELLTLEAGDTNE